MWISEKPREVFHHYSIPDYFPRTSSEVQSSMALGYEDGEIMFGLPASGQ